MYIDPARIVSSTFGGLEAAEPSWADHVEYWEDFTRRFFESNGRVYTESDSNVVRWLSADDRAPFVEMVRALLPSLSGRADLSDVDLIILAHWLPDIHLGTSVTNFALHALDLPEGLGFAISDCGPAAPLLALHCIERYLKGPKKKALLMVMDQKHLLYRSEVVRAIDPVNSASLVSIEQDAQAGLRYCGYRRHHTVALAELSDIVHAMAADFGLVSHSSTLIAPPEIAETLSWHGPVLIQDKRLLCSAPFAVLAEHGQCETDYLVLVPDQSSLTGVGLSTRREVTS